ncbi:MAG: TetR/AcrR family transcriptional regulator [Pseudoramibacter sp.]
MKEKRDRRQQKTRQAILKAFKILLTQKRYSAITVQNIVDLADVGRSTFYAHFETKDMLLEELCNDIRDHVVSQHLKAESSHDFSETPPNPRTVITHIFYHLRDDHSNLVSMMTDETRALFLHYFKNSLIDMFRVIWRGAIARSELPEDFLLNHIAGAFVNTLDWWISRQLSDTPENIAAYYLKTVEPVLAASAKSQCV